VGAADGGRTAVPSLELPDGERDVGAPDGDVRAVPADVRSRLRREVGPAADLMRVHTGAHADALARAADADAVTVGPDVHLRQGRWAPRREEGVALLAHEATHVAVLVDRGTAWRRAVGEDAEESLAMARERSLLGAGPPLAGPTVPDTLAAPRHLAADPGPAPAPAASPAGQPAHHSEVAAPAAATVPLRGSTVAAAPAMRADVQRDLAPAAPAQDLEGLRRSVIDDVMQRLRSEIERGA